MSTVDEKSIKVIEFTGKDFKIWSRKFCARANRKGYLTLLRGTQRIPTLSEYIAAEASPSDATNKITIKLWKLNELAFEDIILSINHTTNQGKTAFHLVDNSITSDQPDGNCKVAWENLYKSISLKQPHLISSSRKNSQIALLEKHPLLQMNGLVNWKV